MSNFMYVTADSYEECVEKIRSLYGMNYQLLQKKFVKTGGFLGMFQHEAVQVTYTVLPETQTRYMPPKQAVPRTEEDFERERNKILDGSKTQVNPQFQKILDEFKALKDDISEIKTNGTAQEDEGPESIVRIRDLLEANEFSPAYIRGIIERIRREFSLEEIEDVDRVQSAVVDWIGQSIKLADTNLRERPQVIILVGPTGVGKTTTVAKMAAMYSPPTKDFMPNSRVKIITIDNYRIAGAAQIEKYGELMGIQVDSIKNVDELTRHLDVIKSGTDVILIDTMGFSPKDYEHIGKMKSILDVQGLKPIVYLAMTASTKASDMREIMHKYEIFNYEGVIITKLDETRYVGNLISVMAEKKQCFAYFTTGQKVPSDFEKADAAELLLQLNDFKIDRIHIQQMFSAENGNTHSDGLS